MNPRTQTIFAIVLLLLNAGGAIYLWPSNTPRSLALLLIVICFTLVWIGARALAKRRGCDWAAGKARREIVGAIVFAGLILLGSLALAALRDHGVIEGDTSRRLMGVCMGAVVVIMGNALPKRLAPIPGDEHTPHACAAGCAGAKSQSLRRFMGWTFVIAGLLYMGIWCVVDLNHITQALLLAFPGAIALIVAARLVTLRGRRAKAGAKGQAHGSA